MTTAGGLRERKKRKTRESIQREAMRLFRKQGYEETTVEQIAEAAEISPSTFFNYFPSKEDVVLTDDYDPMMAAALAGRPPEEPLTVALRKVVESLRPVLERDRDVILARTKLIYEVPELRARVREAGEQAHDFLRGLIASRTERDPEDFELRVATAALFAGMFEAIQVWVESDGREDFADLVLRAIGIIEGGVRLGHPAREPGREGRPA